MVLVAVTLVTVALVDVLVLELVVVDVDVEEELLVDVDELVLELVEVDVVVAVVVVLVTSQPWNTPPSTPKYASIIELICSAAATHSVLALTTRFLFRHSIVTGDSDAWYRVNSAEAAVSTLATVSHSAKDSPAVKRWSRPKKDLQVTAAEMVLAAGF